VYALGAVLYECLTGRPPFRAPNLLETLAQVRDCEPAAPRRLQPGVSRDLETICLKCLHKEPGRRYARAVDLAEDLDRFLQGQPILARPVGPAERFTKWARRHPALVGLLAVSVLGLAALAVAGVVYEQRLRVAWLQAEANASDARRQKERADANYRQARDTLREVLQQARERDAAGLPRMTELQRRQSEKALDFFLKLADQAGDDPEVRYDAARARCEVGHLQHYLGRSADAVASLRGARDLFAALADEFPADPHYRAAVAGCLVDLGCLDSDPLVKVQCTEQSVNLFEGLVRDHPDSGDHRAALANACNNLAGVRAAQGRRDEAAHLYRRSVDLCEALLRDRPEDRQMRLRLADMCGNFSVFLQKAQVDAECKQLHERAEAEYVRLIRDDPNDFQARTGLATIRVNWAYVLRAQKQTETALAELTKNVQDLEALLRQEPTYAPARDRLFRSYGLRADTYREWLRRFPEALADQKRAVEYADDASQRHRLHLVLAMDYALAGQPDEALRESEVLARAMRPNSPPVEWLQLGMVCGQAALAVRRDASRSTSARQEQEQRLVVKALEYLRKARQADPAKWPDLAMRHALPFNRHLAPVRAHAGWRELFTP
jgi:tetratricopeptide (TPR) repeat protein